MTEINTSPFSDDGSEMKFKRCSRTKLDEFFKSPSMDFLARKRKRRRKLDDDTLSLQSVDSILSTKEEPKQKRRCSLARVGSLANLLSPVKPVKKVSHALQRSLSWKNLLSPTRGSVPQPHTHTATPYRPPPPTPPKRRQSLYWHETVPGQDITHFNKLQIDRQEAIYELYKSDEDLLEDLHMVSTTYQNSMRKLGLMSESELEQIFGNIDCLLPVHEDLVCALKEQRLPDGRTENVGQVLVDWVPKLSVYVTYCSNQVYAKAVLDLKKNDPAVEDFLERCIESPFSRKLDLWSFLDYPRSRLVKYPLLFKAIQKKTPARHEDISLIEQAVDMIEEIIHQVDKRTGQAKCTFTRQKLDFIDDKQRQPLLEESDAILCDGVLKNNRGTKLYAFLFNKVLVLTRPATRSGQLKYQVYRQPLPVSEIVLEDLKDGQKMGSFKTAFSQTQTSKNIFKVSLRDPTRGQSHTLQANDEHDKRQWLQCLRSVISSDDKCLSTSTSSSSVESACSSKSSACGPLTDSGTERLHTKTDDGTVCNT